MPLVKPKTSVMGVRILVLQDDHHDMSYLEQEGFEDRLAAYRAGDFSFVGVRLDVKLNIAVGDDWVFQSITTPGLWSIESDSGEDYFREVAADEFATLAEMLAELCVPLPDPHAEWPLVYR